MLRSVEDLYGLPHIGYAQLPGEQSFGSDIFACAPAHPAVATRGKLPVGSEIESVRVSRRHGKVSLALYSVGNASLRVTIKAKHHRTVVIKRTLVPCHSYTLSLPSGTGRTVSVSASANGGAQTVSARY